MRLIVTTNLIPDAALDDRLAFTGTSGYGKTYNASCAIERVLKRNHRALVVDPLGVWWGLRLMADGKAPSPFEVVIFGGKHGDLPLNDHAGTVIGETVATMRESCIVDLSGLSSGKKRRAFMLDFLESLYEATDPRKVEPYHAVFDEADLWAPQKPIEYDHKQLQARMEEIVRRGRVKGFIPWLITQRPAVLSKDVLSQADGLISFRLTSSQDRNALGAWVSSSADENEWKPKGKPGLYGRLAEFQKAEGLVWLPGRGILTVGTFPEKLTFDSSRTPKRGERKQARELKPLDVEGLKSRLSTVEEEVKANDPAKLKAEVARLTGELAKAQKAAPAPQDTALEADRRAAQEALEKNAYQLGLGRGHRLGADAMLNAVLPGITDLGGAISGAVKAFLERVAGVKTELQHPPEVITTGTARVAQPAERPTFNRKVAGSSPAVRSPTGFMTQAQARSEQGAVSPSARKVLDEIHRASPVSLSFAAAAARAAISKRSSQYRRYKAEVEGSGEVSLEDGRLRSLMPAGIPDSPGIHPVDAWASRLPPSIGKMLKVIAASGAPVSRQVIAEGAGVSVTSSGLGTGLSELLRLDLISKAGTGEFQLNEALR